VTRYRRTPPLTALAATLTLLAACVAAPEGDGSAFAALQARGEVAMGVDQYTSTHLFDALPDGGRIEFRYDREDPEAIATIREHLQEIQAAFSAGDFSTPAFIHAQQVPGADVMAARADHIEYAYRELPRGGELRLTTDDPETLDAIRAFMAFQRDDHHAGGMDHTGMDRTGVDQGAMGHDAMDHRALDHGAMGRGAMGRGAMDGTEHQGMLGGADPAFAADMEIVHELLTNHRAITRTVDHLPNGIRTLTESQSPAIAGLIAAHVASMERRLQEGEVFNLFSHSLPILFENYDRIQSEFEYLPTGVALVQTSEDPEIVQALQAHAAEVTELVDEGMIAMMRGMMESGRGRMQGMQGMHGMHGMGGMGGDGGMMP
jgi:hypothetical protein